MPDFGEPEPRTLTEAIDIGLTPLGEKEDIGWRPLTKVPSKFDLTPVTQRKMCQIAQYLYLSNPLAHRIVELSTAFAVGGGVSFEFKDSSVDAVARGFWTDPINAWNRKLFQRVRELSLYGEQCYPIYVRNDGSVRLGYINPLDIVSVELDRSNLEIVRSVKLVTDLATIPGKEPKLAVVSYDEDPRSDTYGFLTGECFFFAINKASDATRGTSDLLPLADSISIYDQFLFNALERSAHMNAWLWDVTLTGKSDSEIRGWLNSVQARAPKPGSIRAHNENVVWTAIAPTLGAQDIAEAARMFKLYVLGGAGFPEHYFGESGRAGRAVADSMAEPVFKGIQARQGFVKQMLTHIIQFVIDQAIIHKVLPTDIDREFSVTMPELALRDLQRTGGAMFRIAQALAIAEERNWMDKEECRKVFREVPKQLGL